MVWPDTAFDRGPAQPFVIARPQRSRAQIGAADAEREASPSCAVDQRRTDSALACLRIDPHRGDPWCQLRALGEIGCDHRCRTKKNFAVMGDQRKRNRRGTQVLPQTARNIFERMAVRLPPGLPDPVGNRIEELRALPQVADREGKGHGIIYWLSLVGSVVLLHPAFNRKRVKSSGAPPQFAVKSS